MPMAKRELKGLRVSHTSMRAVTPPTPTAKATREQKKARPTGRTRGSGR